MVEKCPGGRRYTDVDDGKAACAVCSVEFPVARTYQRKK